MRFAKWHGAGNDFLLFLPEDGENLLHQLPRLAPRLCHRHFGLGADGVLLLLPTAPGHLRLVYLNSDGSPAAFCANGTRCAAAFAAQRLGQSSWVLHTDFAPIPAQVQGREVTLTLPPPQDVQGWQVLPVGGQEIRAFFLHFGTPHLVVPVDWPDFWQASLALAPPLRRHPLLGPAGANVHFVQVGENLLFIRSFERGVEGETLSCGSGAVAAAQVALAEGWLSSPVVVKTASGRNLQVRATGSAAFGPAELTGPAEPVASGEVAPELLAWENGL